MDVATMAMDVVSLRLLEILCLRSMMVISFIVEFQVMTVVGSRAPYG